MYLGAARLFCGVEECQVGGGWCGEIGDCLAVGTLTLVTKRV